jgi:hypothetical protein
MNTYEIILESGEIIQILSFSETEAVQTFLDKCLYNDSDILNVVKVD